MLALIMEPLHINLSLLSLSLVAPQPVPVSVDERGIILCLKAKAKVLVPIAFSVLVEACLEKNAIKNGLLWQSERAILLFQAVPQNHGSLSIHRSSEYGCKGIWGGVGYGLRV